MLVEWFICAAVFNISPVHSSSTELSRKKRTDDFIPCDEGWFQFREKCFTIRGKRRADRIPWDKADTRCKHDGGGLAIIHSKEESDFIFAFLLLDANTQSWIGLHDRQVEEFVWVDGSPLNFTKWRPNEPSGFDFEDCVRMTIEPPKGYYGHWADISCDQNFGYICQANINRRKKSQNPQYCSMEEGGGLKFRESCFHVVMEMKNWEDAEKHCRNSYNGRLATVLDEGVDLHLDYILSDINRELWIGMKIKDELPLKWTSGWYVSYNRTNKNTGEVTDETCVLRRNSTFWPMARCSKRYPFLCEVSKANLPVLKPAVKGSYCPEVPNDWIDLGGQFCYFIETKKFVSMYEANFDCQRRGGYLLSLHSKEEAAILKPFVDFKVGSIFVGLMRRQTYDEDFVWNDGSLLDYENWSANEPSNDNNKCTEVLTNIMEWIDAWCTRTRAYICKVRKVSPPNATTVTCVTINNEPETTSAGLSNRYPIAIGVTVSVLLLVVVIGVVVYCFRCRNVKPRKGSIPESTTSNCSPRYRFETRSYMDREDDYYETMT